MSGAREIRQRIAAVGKTRQITSAMQRIAYARDLLKKGGFTFDKDRSIERSRRKTAAWPKDEAEMQQVWKDMVEEQLLSEILRRETVARLAKEQNKPDPLANEKPVEEKPFCVTPARVCMLFPILSAISLMKSSL